VSDALNDLDRSTPVSLRCPGADFTCVGVLRSVSELSGQIHHHHDKLAATHSDKRFRLLIAGLDHDVIVICLSSLGGGWWCLGVILITGWWGYKYRHRVTRCSVWMYGAHIDLSTLCQSAQLGASSADPRCALASIPFRPLAIFNSQKFSLSFVPLSIKIKYSFHSSFSAFRLGKLKHHLFFSRLVFYSPSL